MSDRTPSRVNPLRFLIVDDNEDAADILALALTLNGHEIRTAYNGAIALRVAAEFQPDIAILDIGLPVMNGYELASQLSNMPGLKSVRLVALTGYTAESDRERAWRTGFDHFFAKPATVEAFDVVIACHKASSSADAAALLPANDVHMLEIIRSKLGETSLPLPVIR